jgi:hypothetical protein
MITDQLPLCERCGRRPGRPYQVHWGTLERRPLRDDQESGGYVVIQNGYRIDGSLTVSLCDRCAYARLALATAPLAVALLSLGGLMWAVVSRWVTGRPMDIPMVFVLLVIYSTAAVVRAASRAGLLAVPYRVRRGEYQACDLARERGRIPRWVTALTRFELAKLAPPDADGIRWKRV